MRNLSTYARPVAATAALALFLAGAALTRPALAEEAPPMITVTGEATVQAAPDMATLSIGVTTQGATATEALGANSKAMEAVLARLKAAGVEERDLQTANLSVNPNFTGYENGQTPTIAGYTAGNQLSVRIRALDGLGAVLDAAVADGANTLNGVTFGLIDPKPRTDEARKAAVADAIARATLLVEAAGHKLGPIVSITEGGGYGGGPQPMFRADASAMAVPVAQGEVGVTASVSIVFRIAE